MSERSHDVESFFQRPRVILYGGFLIVLLIMGALYTLGLVLKHYGQIVWLLPVVTSLGWVFSWCASQSEAGRGLLRVIGIGNKYAGFGHRFEPETQVTIWAVLTGLAVALSCSMTWF